MRFRLTFLVPTPRTIKRTPETRVVEADSARQALRSVPLIGELVDVEELDPGVEWPAQPGGRGAN